MTKNSFLLFWTFFGAIAMVSVAFLPWRFQVNDDVVMMWLVSGAYTGEPESYAVFIHPLLSWSFAKLYTAYPIISWYESVWFLSIYVSFVLLVFSISKTESHLYFKSLLAFFSLIVSVHFGIFPQFTLIAGFATFSANVVLINERLNAARWIAFILLSFGIMIRWESSLLIALGLVFYLVLQGKAKLKVSVVKKTSGVVLIFLSLIGSKVVYEKTSPHSEFLKFNRLRAAVIDHPVFYQEILEDKIPVNSDLFFFSRWFFEDRGISDSDLLEKKKQLDSELYSKEYLISSLARLWRLQRVEAFKSFLILGVFIFFFLSMTKTPALWFFLLAWMLFFLVFNHFFLIQGRVIFLFFLCLLFPVFRADFLKTNGFAVALAFSLLVLALGYHISNFLKEAKGRSQMDREFLSLTSRLEPSLPFLVEGYHEHNFGIRFSLVSPVPFISTGWISR
ncbi:MAG: hypothetical protein MUE75_09945, partial [Algoriphagus sp.]|nr:hypothetical protein [Algoriphagus sp.]